MEKILPQKIKRIEPRIWLRPSKTIHETLECESEESHENRESRRRRRPVHGTGQRITGGHRADRSFRPGSRGGGGAGIAAGAPSGFRVKEKTWCSQLSNVPGTAAQRYLRSGCASVPMVCPSVGPREALKGEAAAHGDAYVPPPASIRHRYNPSPFSLRSFHKITLCFFLFFQSLMLDKLPFP